MKHLTPEELSARLDAAEGAARERIERHLAECRDCRDALAEIAARDAALRRALDHDPGEAYFESFAARVEDRIRAAGLKGAQSRLGGGGHFAWPRSPRWLAWAGATAAVVVGAGIVMLTSRSTGPLLESPRLLERSQQQDVVTPPGAPASEMAAPDADQTMKNEQAQEPSISKEEAGAKQERLNANAVPSRQKDARGRDQAAVEEKEQDVSGLTSGARMEGTPAAPAPAAKSARAQEVRRTEGGEDVPVRADEYKFAEPPSGAYDAAGKLEKPKAQPMETQAKRSAIANDRKLGVQQEGTRLCGRVVDAQGRAVAGATVVLPDQGRSATADGDGRFCVQSAAGLHELTAMAVGYNTTRMQVRVEGETSEALVSLAPVPVLGQALSLRDGSSNARALAARAYDDTAAALQKVVAATPRGTARLEARYRLAEARYRAWLAEPTQDRAAAARSALDAYLREAPAGPARDQARGWRQQVK